MKYDPAHLLYHAMHSRTMRSYLTVFIVLAAIAVGCIIAFVRVEVPHSQISHEEGVIIYRQDAFTRFRVRQHSALPLRLPNAIEPAAQIPVPKHPISAYPLPQLLPPPLPLPSASENISAIPDDAYLLELPPLQDKKEDAP